ncbi:hypothetical protein [Stenotrophomonas sp.]|uniref:hypothetical protein n=1 Tax=Stenotrophomonas sp. TaxID=69392 RepID=UPI00289F35B8|nr:hypothetical protein [Stenotrophomonas sp.]
MHHLFLSRVATVLAVLAISACGGFPGISVDIKALGSAPLGQKLQSIWMNSPPSVETRLKAWLLARPDPAACLASADCLQQLGFHQCAPAGGGLHCSYDVVMTGTLFKPGDVRVPLRYEMQITLETHAGAISSLTYMRYDR